VDLIQAYKVEVLWLKPNVFWGSAKTWWQNKFNTFETNFYIKVPNDVNDINQYPPVWSIVFWNYGDYWHVAIVVKSKEWERYFEVFEQNMGDGNW
jgi:hypothetical protein